MTCVEAKKFVSKYYPNWDDSKFTLYANNFDINVHKKIKELSQGTKTKLAIALAVAKRPKIYILDEPTSGLDPIVRSEILNVLKK
jgi:ABC-2 type transport system ATP-binding protein